jgi:cytochrome c556
MRRSALRTTVVLGSLAAVIAVGCATTQTAKMSPADAVAERQKLMKANGAAWKSVQENTKAGNITAVAADADTMAQNAKKIPALFPPGSLEGKTAAKPEIWQKWPEFETSAKNMEMEAGKLRDTAKTNDKAATEALVKDFGRKACGTCHTPFRVPPPPAPAKG